MEICILSIGKISSDWIQKGVAQFEARISNYIKFKTEILPDVKAKSLTKEQIKQEEGKLLISKLTSSDYIVLCDEHGKEFTSTGLSEWIQKIMNSGKKRLVFIIGGPYGFSREIHEKGNFKISLSQMTMTHEMAKLFLTEQIYRGFTILRGEPYHHE